MTTNCLVVCLQATIEHRKLAVDLAEVIIKWEVQRIKEDMEATPEVGHTYNKITMGFLITFLHCISKVRIFLDFLFLNSR